MLRPAFAVVLFALAPAAVGQPTPEVGRVETAMEVVHYDLVGTTLQDLAASLAVQGPRQDGRRFFGLTEWEVNVEYRWSELDTGCVMQDVVVRVAIQTTMPRWRPRGQVHPRTKHAWDRFVRALDAHERVHQELSAEAGDALRWRLVGLREPTCETMEPTAERAIADILGEYEARNRAYDHRTGHGRTEGAVWPPE